MIMDSTGQIVPCSEEDIQFVFRRRAVSARSSTKGKEREADAVNEIDLPIPEEALRQAFALEDMAPSELVGDEAIPDAVTAARAIEMRRRVDARRVLAKKLRKIHLLTERRTGQLLRVKSGCYQPEILWERAHLSNPQLVNQGIWPALTSEDLLQRLMGDSQDELNRYALHSILMSRPDLFQADESDMRLSGKFAARPAWMVDDLEAGKKALQVWESGPEGKGSDAAQMVQEFVVQTRQVIQARREQNDQHPVPNPDLTAGTKLLLRLLKQRILEQRTIQPSPYWQFVPALLSATGLFKDETLDMTVLHRFLWEMGELGIAGNVTSTKLKDLEVKEGNVRIEGVEKWPFASVKASSTDSLARRLNLPDTHESHRQYFGNMPVYVIDSEDAKELDDGISLESVPGSGDAWINVHIADPTRWISPESDIASQAMRHGSTLYATADGGRSMMPSDLVMSEMSLGATKNRGHTQVVLTFSAKVNEKGIMQDYRVRAGVVSNVKVVTYDAVDNILNAVDPSNSPTWPSQSLRGEEDSLRRLHTIAKNMRRHRMAETGLEWFTTEAEVHVPNKDKPSEIEWQAAENPYLSSRILVSECMILAGQVAGRFGAENGLSLPYRGSNASYIPQRGLPEGMTPERALQDLLDRRDPVTLASSHLDITRANVFIRGMPPGPRPLDHWILGVKAEAGGYSRVTSPLRRFADMVGHWQIKHALLPGRSKPLFDEAAMERLCVYTNKVDRRIKRLDTVSRNFWKARAVKQALDKDGIMTNGTNLHDVTGIVSATTDYSTIRKRKTTFLTIPGLGSRIQLAQTDTSSYEDLQRWEIGERVRARINEAVLWPTPIINAVPYE